MLETKRGMVVGYEDKHAIVTHKKEVVYISDDRFSDNDREDKAKGYIGSIVSFCVTSKINNRLHGDRITALEQIRQISTISKGCDLKAHVLMVFPKVILVECEGHEVFIPVQKCLPYWNDNLQVSGEFEPGDDIEVIVENIDPIQLKVKFLQNLSKVKRGGNYLGEVKSVTEKGSFIKLSLSDVIVHCRPVDWRKSLIADDTVIIEVTEIKEEQNRVYGFVRRRIRGKRT